jgi:hypothetical protein
MASAQVLIKRQARSRLYDAPRGRYVTLAELHLWRHKRVAFVVQDAETGEDAARAVRSGRARRFEEGALIRRLSACFRSPVFDARSRRRHNRREG